MPVMMPEARIGSPGFGPGLQLLVPKPCQCRPRQAVVEAHMWEHWVEFIDSLPL